MKTCVKNLFRLPALMASLGLILAGRVTAQTFTTLYSFTATIPYTNDLGGVFYTNSDGAGPNGLILSGDTLYGTTPFGGSSGNGAVFALNTDGTGFTTLYSFTAFNDYYNSDGAYPNGGLILSGNALYGTAPSGGSSGRGTVFAVTTDGTGFTTLHKFAGDPYAGSLPQAWFILCSTLQFGPT